MILRPIIFAGRPHQVVAVRDLKARKDAEEHIYFLAHHDALTRLPNRSHFNARIDQEIAALTRGDRLAVLCLDLDRFKEVNDLFGHAAGDKVLQIVASRVTAVLGERQMMARLGGDEFAVLMPDIADPAAASRLAETILDALRVSDEASETHIATSIGIAICPDDATDRQSLLTHADTALYRAKTEGRNTYRFFEAKMGAEVRDRRMLEHDLRLAIARAELRLAYQPQQEARSGEVTGFETLLRWKHPTRGEISPSVFIPIAEETGTILQIGDWVLKTACREAATWTRPLKIAVNVSAVQLYNANFVQQLHQILLDTGLSPRRLEIEITETALVRDFNRTLSMLRQIKALGVGIAMDDFGTGYSSLSNLRAFPFDRIKIDRSFIRSVNSNGQAATIVRAVLGLGRGLGLPVLAEGVETSAELQFLQDEMCDRGAGLFARASERDRQLPPPHAWGCRIRRQRRFGPADSQERLKRDAKAADSAATAARNALFAGLACTAPFLMRRRGEQGGQLLDHFFGIGLRVRLLSDNPAIRVEDCNDRRVVEAAACVATVAHAERRGELAHRLVVALIERPMRGVETVVLGIGRQALGRVDRQSPARRTQNECPSGRPLSPGLQWRPCRLRSWGKYPCSWYSPWRPQPARRAAFQASRACHPGSSSRRSDYRSRSRTTAPQPCHHVVVIVRADARRPRQKADRETQQQDCTAHHSSPSHRNPTFSIV